MLFSLLLLISLTCSFASYDEMLNKYALNISQASYCVSSPSSWNCATCDKSIEITDIIENGGVRALNALDHINAKIIVAFRGSSNIKNWINNIQFSHVKPYNDYEDVSVDKGFYKALGYVKEPIFDFIANIVPKYPNYNILITGHSLGGALSTLASFEMVYIHGINSGKIELLTFGSPRVGNNVFKKYMLPMGVSWRTTHYYDIVPHVPEEFLDYIHISQEIWYNENSSVYKICDDEVDEDNSCSNSCAPTKCTSTSDHMTYLNISMGNDGLCE